MADEFTITKVAELNIEIAESRARRYTTDDNEEGIFLFGGKTDGDETAVIQRFNPETYNVENYMSLPDPVGWAVVGQSGDKFYTVLGQVNSSGSGSDYQYIVEIDLDDKTASKVYDRGSGAYDHMGGGLNDKIIYWGSKGEDPVDPVEIFDPSSQSVSTGSSMANYVDDAGAVEFGGGLYDIGGRDGSDARPWVHKVDSNGNHTYVGDLTVDGSSYGISKVRPTEIGGDIYIAGGERDSNDLTAVVQLTGPTEGTKIGDLNTGTRDLMLGHSLSTGNAYVFGGRQGTDVVGDIYEIEFDFSVTSDFVFETASPVFLGSANQNYVIEGDRILDITDEGNSDFAFIDGSPINSA